MNGIVNTFLLTGDKFMPKLHLRQQVFAYSAWGQFTKLGEMIQKFKKVGHFNYIYKDELDQAYFAQNAAYAASKDLAKSTVLGKILKDWAYEIALNSKFNRHQRWLQSMMYKFLIRIQDQEK